MEYVMQITGGFKDDKGEGLKIIGQLWNEHVGEVVSERSQRQRQILLPQNLQSRILILLP